MPIVAFDSIEFKRKSKVAGEFYTPLGAGVWFKEGDFRKVFREKSKRLAASFGLDDGRFFRSADYLKYGIGLRKAVPFCDQLVSSLQDSIKAVHLSYVILPPQSVPEVEVGGLQSPTEKVRTSHFLRDLHPMFPYIAAWAFLGRPVGVPDWEIYLDGFRSKYTEAWDDLLMRVQPKIFFHGDECNPYINMADMVAFLTNIKLGNASSQELRRLTPDNAKAVWQDYSFSVDTRFLDEHLLGKIIWRSKELIDTGKYLARPMTFLLVDDLLKSPKPPAQSDLLREIEEEPAYLSGVVPKLPPKPRKFSERFERTEPGIALANYAYMQGGGYQSFDPIIDENKIRDGDTLVYAGPESKHRAETYADMYELQILSASEIRKQVKEYKW